MSIRLLPQTIRSFSSIPSKLPRLPAVRDLVQLYGLKARSQLSQNFILDKNITDKIVRSSQTQYAPDSLVVEVGPGPGLLTRSLLDAGVQRLIAVEKDSRFLPSLHQLAEASDHRLTILHGDMLKVTPEDIQALLPAHTKPSSLHIVGNLPFGIASPLLITWLRGIYGSSDLFSLAPPASLTLMFQKEVANRLVAPVRTPGRGRLSVMTQAICDPHISYKVPARIFVPSPDVDASIVHLVPSEQRLLQGSYKHLEDLVRFCFSKRRKTLGHTLRPLGSKVLDLLDHPHFPGLSSEMRPEEVSTEAFCRFSKELEDQAISIPLPAEARVMRRALKERRDEVDVQYHE